MLKASSVASLPAPDPVSKVVLSQFEGTQSVDFGFLNTLAGAGGRGSLSIARDNEGDYALISSEGFAGGTPAGFLGFSLTVSNAPTVQHLKGHSVQIGGSLEEGLGVFGEFTLFPGAGSGESYHGLTIGAVGTYPDPLPGSIHGSWEHSQIIVATDWYGFYDDLQRFYFGKDAR